MSDALIDGHDAALFDLDGVVYLGPHPVPAAPDTIAELRRRGVKVGFVTNLSLIHISEPTRPY